MPKKKNLTLYAITHTETFYNRQLIFTGQLSSNLTPRGHRQAERLGQKLKAKKIDIAFISPLARSRQTLTHILRHHTLGHITKYHPHLKVLVDKRLAERDYGKLAHKSKAKFRKLHPKLYEIYHRSYETAPPGGESMIVVERRVKAFLKDAIALMKRKKVNALVIAHNNSIRPIRRYFEKLTAKQVMQSDNHNRVFAYKIKV